MGNKQGGATKGGGGDGKADTGDGESAPKSPQPVKKGNEQNMSNKQLNELPSSIGNMKCARFDASNNNIGEIPPEVGNMANLEVLVMDDNRLNGLPDELGNCQNLKELHFANNKLFYYPVRLVVLNSRLRRPCALIFCSSRQRWES